jgi:hypothetical protein
MPAQPTVGAKAKVPVAQPSEPEWEPDVPDHERSKADTLKGWSQGQRRD